MKRATRAAVLDLHRRMNSTSLGCTMCNLRAISHYANCRPISDYGHNWDCREYGGFITLWSTASPSAWFSFFLFNQLLEKLPSLAHGITEDVSGWTMILFPKDNMKSITCWAHWHQRARGWENSAESTVLMHLYRLVAHSLIRKLVGQRDFFMP